MITLPTETFWLTMRLPLHHHHYCLWHCHLLLTVPCHHPSQLTNPMSAKLTCTCLIQTHCHQPALITWHLLTLLSWLCCTPQLLSWNHPPVNHHFYLPVPSLSLISINLQKILHLQRNPCWWSHWPHHLFLWIRMYAVLDWIWQWAPDHSYIHRVYARSQIEVASNRLGRQTDSGTHLPSGQSGVLSMVCLSL